MFITQAGNNAQENNSWANNATRNITAESNADTNIVAAYRSPAIRKTESGQRYTLNLQTMGLQTVQPQTVQLQTDNVAANSASGNILAASSANEKSSVIWISHSDENRECNIQYLQYEGLE